MGTNAQSEEIFSSADEEHARCQPGRVVDEFCPDAAVLPLQLTEPDQGDVLPMETNAHSSFLSAGETRAEFQPGAGGGPDGSPVGGRPQCDSDDAGGEDGPRDMSVDEHRGKATEILVSRFGASLNPVRRLFSLFSLLTCSLGGSI